MLIIAIIVIQLMILLKKHLLGLEMDSYYKVPFFTSKKSLSKAGAHVVGQAPLHGGVSRPKASVRRAISFLIPPLYLKNNHPYGWLSRLFVAAWWETMPHEISSNLMMILIIISSWSNKSHEFCP